MRLFTILLLTPSLAISCNRPINTINRILLQPKRELNNLNLYTKSNKCYIFMYLNKDERVAFRLAASADNDYRFSQTEISETSTMPIFEYEQAVSLFKNRLSVFPKITESYINENKEAFYFKISTQEEVSVYVILDYETAIRVINEIKRDVQQKHYGLSLINKKNITRILDDLIYKIN